MIARPFAAANAPVSAPICSKFGCRDPDDSDGELTWEARRDVLETVDDRRQADKVGPLIHWATRTVATDERLRAATPAERIHYFRSLLPPAVIGGHAVSHLGFGLGDQRRCWVHSESRPPAVALTLRDMVQRIVAAGRHGDLNRAIRRDDSGAVAVTGDVPAHRLIDHEHPAPGLLVARKSVTEYRRRTVRFLAGAHDVDAFVDNLRSGGSESRAVRSFYAEMSERAQ